ncbi:MAG: TRL-like family protein [Leptospira sp.]|nr:TRL-like family protein [Leptospira sp.]
MAKLQLFAFSICCICLLLPLTCASSGVGPKGMLFTNTAIGVYGTGSSGSLSGKSCIHSILGLVSFGDASIQTIKAKSSISEVMEVNWETKNFIGLYASLCVLIRGN